MEIKTIASSSNSKPLSKAQEQRKNEALIKLYKQFQEKPFDYAIIDYYEGGKTKISTFSKNSPIKNFFKKILRMIIK